MNSVEHADLLLHVPLTDSLVAAYARGEPRGIVAPAAAAPMFESDGRRSGAHFTRNGCVIYRIDDNFNREAGTVMMWFRPDWSSPNFEDKVGWILWDLRIDHGSIVPDDPSQRWALVFPSAANRGMAARPDDTFGCWRLCIATNRNRYVIGTREPRKDRRTRQAVFSRAQEFAADTWMHLAVTWNAHTGAVFVDGREDVRRELPEGLPDRPLPEHMQLGAEPSWINQGPCGMLSDFRVYGIDLSEEEIRRETGLT
jgi:hypothetical protein